MQKFRRDLPEGMTYRVKHQRFYDEDGNMLLNGGKTVVEIGVLEMVDSTITCFVPVVIAVAVCSDLDPYEKKRGRDIALGRALKLLGRVRDPDQERVHQGPQAVIEAVMRQLPMH